MNDNIGDEKTVETVHAGQRNDDYTGGGKVGEKRK
jgi:hypothetical protein